MGSYNNNNSQQVPSMVANQHFLEMSVGVSHNKEVATLKLEVSEKPS